MPVGGDNRGSAGEVWSQRQTVKRWSVSGQVLVKNWGVGGEGVVENINASGRS